MRARESGSGLERSGHVPLKSRHFAGNAQLQKAAENSPPLRQGATGDGVAVVQQALLEVGITMPISIASGRPDGIYGDETAAAVRKFQRQVGLLADGIAGRQTLLRLDGLYVLQERSLPPINPHGRGAITARRDS
jgi:murein L,D-transpeptidase YcbB/YkuD